QQRLLQRRAPPALRNLGIVVKSHCVSYPRVLLLGYRVFLTEVNMSDPENDATKVDPAVWRTVWTVLVGGLAVLFDTTIVAVALHTLAGDLHTSVATIQWVSTGYL